MRPVEWFEFEPLVCDHLSIFPYLSSQMSQPSFSSMWTLHGRLPTTTWERHHKEWRIQAECHFVVCLSKLSGRILRYDHRWGRMACEDTSYFIPWWCILSWNSVKSPFVLWTIECCLGDGMARILQILPSIYSFDTTWKRIITSCLFSKSSIPYHIAGIFIECVGIPKGIVELILGWSPCFPQGEQNQ